MRLLFSMLFLVSSLQLYSQTKEISGTIKDANGQGLFGVNIKVTNKLVGGITDKDGQFSFKTDLDFPMELTISMIGYETQNITITSQSDLPLQVSLEEDVLIGQEVVVSASRVEESILESPVSIEKMDILDIQQSPSQDFYSAIINQKNVDMSTQSFTFKSLSLRGFNANGNTRLVQLVDGMDNQAPGLNFPVGNIVGISELDLESVELLPGASSALYGPNAINGIILMNSKSPFDYPGLSVMAKTGINHIDGEDEDPSPYLEASLRYALPISDRLAVKVNASYLDATDWQANDERNRSLDGTTRENNPGFEALNIYGDETSTFLPLGANGENVLVTRTGYNESDLVDYTAQSIKLSGALHYKLTNSVEAIFQANYGTGQTVYTGIDRYSLQDFSMTQLKAELKGNNFSLRGYTTQENSGDSYAIGTLGLAMNEALSPSGDWFTNYGAAFGGAVPGVTPFDHNSAREFADSGMALPGSDAFDEARESIINTPLSEGGAKFLDRTDLWAVEGTYNLSDKISFAEVIVGANFRQYNLNSEGTLFALDEEGNEYDIAEYGGFIQASRKLFNDKLKISTSLRYDKNENFDGRTTPRVSGVWQFLDNQYLRLSYQTAFRMPTTQNQYIDLLTPQARLIGGLPVFREKYNFGSNPVYDQATYELYAGTFLTVQGESLAAGQSESEALASAAAAAAPVLEGQEVGETDFELEQNKTIEVGYKGLINNTFMVDAYYYNSRFNNFSGALNLFQSSTVAGDPSGLLAPAVYQTTVSLDQEVKSQGAAISTSYLMPRNFVLSANYAWNELSNQEDFPEGFQAGFNTPEHKFNLSLANRKLTDRLGFNVVWRWQDAFYWESTFAQGDVDAYSTLDLQFSYTLPELKSRLKVGGSNILNNRYEQALGNPTVGGVYYVSVIFDELLIK